MSEPLASMCKVVWHDSKKAVVPACTFITITDITDGETLGWVSVGWPSRGPGF